MRTARTSWDFPWSTISTHRFLPFCQLFFFCCFWVCITFGSTPMLCPGFLGYTPRIWRGNYGIQQFVQLRNQIKAFQTDNYLTPANEAGAYLILGNSMDHHTDLIVRKFCSNIQYLPLSHYSISAGENMPWTIFMRHSFRYLHRVLVFSFSF